MLWNYGVPVGLNYMVDDPVNDDEFADIFDVRKQTLRRKMGLLDSLIEQNQQNLEGNLEAIEHDILECDNICHQLHAGVADNYTNDSDWARIQLKYKLPLYQEKRRQQSDYLRDTALLKKDLMDTFLEYLSLKDKERMLQ